MKDTTVALLVVVGSIVAFVLAIAGIEYMRGLSSTAEDTRKNEPDGEVSGRDVVGAVLHEVADAIEDDGGNQ